MVNKHNFGKHGKLIEKLNSISIVSYYHDYVKVGGDDKSYEYFYLFNIDNEYLQYCIELCLNNESFGRNFFGYTEKPESSQGFIKWLYHTDSNTIARNPREGFCFNLNNQLRFLLLSEISFFYDEELLRKSELNYLYSIFKDNKEKIIKIPIDYWKNNDYNKILYYRNSFENKFEITSNEFIDKYLLTDNDLFQKINEYKLLEKENKETIFSEKLYFFYNKGNPCEGFNYRPDRFIKEYFQHKTFIKGML